MADETPNPIIENFIVSQLRRFVNYVQSLVDGKKMYLAALLFFGDQTFDYLNQSITPEQYFNTFWQFLLMVGAAHKGQKIIDTVNLGRSS